MCQLCESFMWFVKGEEQMLCVKCASEKKKEKITNPSFIYFLKRNNTALLKHWKQVKLTETRKIDSAHCRLPSKVLRPAIKRKHTCCLFCRSRRHASSIPQRQAQVTDSIRCTTDHVHSHFQLLENTLITKSQPVLWVWDKYENVWKQIPSAVQRSTSSFWRLSVSNL